MGMCSASSANALEVNRPTKRSKPTTFPFGVSRRITMLSIARRRCTCDSTLVLVMVSGGPSKSRLSSPPLNSSIALGRREAGTRIIAENAQTGFEVGRERAGAIARFDSIAADSRERQTLRAPASGEIRASRPGLGPPRSHRKFAARAPSSARSRLRPCALRSGRRGPRSRSPRRVAACVLMLEFSMNEGFRAFACAGGLERLDDLLNRRARPETPDATFRAPGRRWRENTRAG